MKKMKRFLEKFTKIIMLISMIFSSFQAPIQVFAAELANNDSEIPVGSIKLGLDGEISSNNSVSTEVNSKNNDISVKKTVTAIDASNGKYQVEFEIKGKESPQEKPVYVVVVFDRSGSMAEDKYGYPDYEKWNNAVKGAKTFANSLINDETGLKNAKVALVTFAKKATKDRDFKHEGFVDSNFGRPNEGTNLHDGLVKAGEYFSTIPEEDKTTALKYVVVMSDGKPTYYNYTYTGIDGREYTSVRGNGSATSSNILNATFKEADSLKNSGITIFSIGYGINDNDIALNGDYSYKGVNYWNIKTKEVLELVASSKDNYYSASNESEIVKVFSDLAKEMIVPGKNATLIDNIGSKFKLVENVSDNGSYNEKDNVYQGEVIEKITKNTLTYTFNIEIDPDTETGWYPTNEGFKLIYTDNDGVEQEINSDKDPYVYWKQREYKYIVNYYKDSTSDDNNRIASDERTAPAGTVIDINNVDKDKYLNKAGAGYEFNSIDPKSVTITNTDDETVIKVLYTLKKFSYTVNYYKDNSNVAFESIKVDDVVYGTKVDPKEYYLNLQDNIIIEKYKLEGYKLDDIKSDKNVVTIDSDNKVINVYYVKDMFKFTVNYYFDNNQDTELTKEGTKEYGSTIKASEYHLSEEVLNNKGNYFLDPDKNAYNYQEKKIGTNPDENDLNIYYIKTEIPYGKESIKKTTTNNEIIIDSKTVVNYTVNYEAIVNNVRKDDKITVTIVDTLPAKIDTNNKSTKLNGGVYDENNKTVTWIKEITVKEDFVKEYTVSETVNYSVVYVDYADISASDNNKLTNTVHGNVMVKNINTNGVEDSTEVEVNIQGKLTVRHVDENGEDLLDPVLTTKAVGTTYNETKKEIYGYTFKEDTGNTSGKYIEGTTEVVFTYTKNDGTVTENSVVKTGPENITSVNGVFNYTLTYKGEIKDYKGTAKLTLVDRLPYELDDDSTYEGCTYNAQDKTLTCEREFTVSENNTKVEASFALSLKFKNIDSDKITNKVESKLEYGNNHEEDDDETETEVFKGTVIARYFDENGEKIASEESSEGLGESEYTTSKKDIYGYTYKTVVGEENGKYTAKETIYVDYIYTKNDGTVTENVTTKNQVNEIVGSNSKFEYVLSYNGKIEDYTGEAKITLTDKLPYTVKDISYDQNYCSFDKNSNTLVCEKIFNIDKDNQEINVEFRVEVTYIGLTSTTDLAVKNVVDAILTYGNNEKPSQGEVTDIVKSSKVIAKYVDEDGNELALQEEMTGLIDSEYTTHEKSILGYTLKEMPVNKNGVYTEEDIIVKYVYTKNIGTSEEEVKKIGLESVSSTNDAFIYTITYQAEIKDYVGGVKLVITDILPYEIDTDKSVIDTNNNDIVCKYIDGKIVCEYTKTINSEEDSKIDIAINLELYFKNVDSEIVINKVEAMLTYGDTEKSSKDETGTKVLKGTVIVNYVTEEGEELAPSEEMTGLVGSEYKTNKKAFDKYYLKEVKGNETGEYMEETQEVTYVYSLIPLPPQTGYEGNNTNYIGLFILGIVMLLFKKRI